ncbi:hypothetical protein [Methanosarcina vacuolata]|uniref:Uncharacterized protein n=1 Tax=Methanosarcina vacuolata Z-761 TaxID=1434123 RepID=A0A0E3Q5L7_9EURY|nr:hypothetical protein [Methanosarcina vacuolata]AKB43717.1 hypothetical protein MSVAZ_1448 [Methanosarcina vacuolata Z-761]
MPATLFKKGLTENPKNRLNLITLSPNPIDVITTLFKKGLTATLFKKGLTENPKNRLSLITLSPNPIGVINRRNGFGSTVSGQRLPERKNYESGN